MSDHRFFAIQEPDESNRIRWRWICGCGRPGKWSYPYPTWAYTAWAAHDRIMTARAA